MKKLLALAPLLLAASAQAASAQIQTDLCTTIRALTQDPTVASAHWGVSVTTLDGTVLCGVNEAQLFRPASNNKLLTAAATLAMLGRYPVYTATSVFGEGTLSEGVLHGALRLQGGGDANFGSTDVPYLPPAQQPHPAKPEPATIADIEDLADQIVAKGVHAIEGDVIGDDTLYTWDPYPFGWEIDDLETTDGAPVSALTIHDNWLELDVTGGKTTADRPVVTTAPAVPFYTIEADLTTSAPAQSCRGALQLRRDVGSKTIRLTGSVPTGATCKTQVQIQDPAEFAALALKAALERRGVRIGGMAVAQHNRYFPSGPASSAAVQTAARGMLVVSDSLQAADTPDPCSTPVPPQGRISVEGDIPLAKHTSPRLADELKLTLKVSQNLHAEMLMRNLGVVATCGAGTPTSAGLAAVRVFLDAAGIAKDDTVLYDGSGLSGHDLLTPRALTQLLVYATQQTWFPTFKASLPIGGIDGTLASRFGPPASTLQSRVVAKTGTLGEARALSGYVTTVAGTTLAFSVMVDTHRPSGTADRAAMDKIVEAIAATR